jgi:hypothetical protein
MKQLELNHENCCEIKFSGRDNRDTVKLKYIDPRMIFLAGLSKRPELRKSAAFTNSSPPSTYSFCLYSDYNFTLPACRTRFTVDF